VNQSLNKRLVVDAESEPIRADMSTTKVTKFKTIKSINPFVSFVCSYENAGRRNFGSNREIALECVIPAWSAGIQG